jgi:hypothetical protein
MNESSMNAILARLEQATTRLEKMSTGNPTKEEDKGEKEAAFELILQGPLVRFMELGQAVGGLVKEQSQKVAEAVFLM